MSQLVWLVTGCSSGFGEQFVRKILSRGDLVIATAHKPEKIKHLEQPSVTILPLDISSDQSTLNETVSKAISIHGRVDVLVNNAAYAMLGSWEDVEYEQLVAQFETNVFGVFKVTKAVLPHLRQRRSGTMVFIGSRAGWFGDGFAGPYAGSKFALGGLVECLSRETAELGIKTLLIEPGRFKTKLLSTGSAQVIPTRIPDYAASNTTFVHRIAAEDQMQPGDTGKGVRIIVDLVRREGHAATREVPFRLPLGRDCYDTIKEKCEETLAVLRDWESVIKSTDYDT
ncbi:hypothetical protein F4809DRAFT_644939 [Biscogniauxia mediterranea]|nr:hypothetical protein F4809DRAFT_644939 [Biscogniauxia mediterranea]